MTIPEQIEAIAHRLMNEFDMRAGFGASKCRNVAREIVESFPSLMGVVEQMLPQGLRPMLEKFAAQLDAIEAGKAQADQHQRDEGFKPLPSMKDWENVRGLTIGDLRLARVALAALPHAGQPQEGVDDIRWAVNVLLEKIAATFEANDTWDIWKSDAAALVRAFKHDLSAATASPRAEGEDPLRERALKIIADEEAFAAKDEPGNIQLHALRVARVGTAKQILGLIRMSDAVIAEERTK